MPRISGSNLNDDAKYYNKLFLAAKKYREDHKDAQYQKVAEYLWGNQDIRRVGLDNSERNDFVTNLIYRDYNLAVSMMARDKPTCELNSIMEDKPVEDLLKKITNFVLTKNNSVDIAERVASYGLPFARAYTKTTWDPKLRGGVGDIRVTVVDPRNVYFMPGVGRLGQALIVFEDHQVDKLTAYDMLGPDRKDEVNDLFSKARDQGTQEAGYAEEQGHVKTKLSDASDEISQGYIVDYGQTISEDKTMISVVEAWFYDKRTLKDVPQLFDKEKERKKNDKDYDETELGNTPLYPRGRVCVFCGDHEIMNRPNPLPAFPYAEYFNLNVPVSNNPGDELGMGEWDQAIELNDSYNTRFNQVMDAMDKIALGGWGLYQEGSGIDVDEMDSAPMGWYSCYDISAVKWFETRPLGGEVFHSLKEIKQTFEDIVGRQEILQADMPGDLRSGAAIEELSQLAFGVMKPRTHHLEICLKQTVENIIRMIGFFYEAGVHYQVDDSEAENPQPLKGITPDGFNIFIKAGLNLPSSEQARQAYYLTLQERGVVDRLFLLENSEIPNKEATKNRMEQAWAAEADAQKQAMQAEMSLKQAEVQTKQLEMQVRVMELDLKREELQLKREQGVERAATTNRTSRQPA